MKKIIIIFLSVFYLIIVSGVTYNIHYCGGKFKHITLFNNADTDGCCGNKKKSKGCCKDKTTVIKVQENHQVTKVAQVSNPTIHLLSVLSPQLLFNVPESNIISITSNHHAPPVIYDNPLYLKHRVLLI
jgi:hypothetical protein